MSWLDEVKNSIPDYAKDIRLNLDAVINRSGLDEVDAHACALAAAIAAGNANLAQAIGDDSVLAGTAELNAARTASALMGMNNVYYPFVEMTGDSNLKGLPAGLRMQAYATHGGVSKLKFEMYALCASIVGKCEFCVKAHYDGLKALGYTVDQLRDIGRIAAVIDSVAKVLNS